MARERRRCEGSAVVEFSLVSSLLVMLFACVIQVGITVYVRNTLVAAAAAGARYAASTDRSPGDGATRTRQLIDASLPAAYASHVSAGYQVVGGLDTVVVQIQAPLPMVGLLGPAEELVVRGHALVEVLP